jgi:hypothetical protein
MVGAAMDLLNAALVMLIFMLGAAMGALLNQIYRVARLEKIKTELLGQLEEQVGLRIPEPRQEEASSKPSANYPCSA